MTFREWKPGLIAATVLAVITSLPQIYLCYERGSEWNGAYAYFDSDEFAYSAYLNALIEGRPRRNDPYTGDDSGEFETLFSIQFIPAYSIAIPARIFGFSASAAFIILLPLITIASTLMLFLLLFEFTQNSIVSAIGALGVLCFGILAAQPPWQFFSAPFPFPFPFLRRYMPAFPFPLFFAMTLFMWRSLARNSLIWSAFAGLTFVALIYSYFYLWTAAAAWLVTLMILWMVARPHDYRMIVRVFGVIVLIGGVALVPYLWLLAHRSPVIDQSQLLEFTHWPDLKRGPELFGVLILLVLAAVKRRAVDWRDPKILFLLSFALAPIVVFNHQVLTGRSLQPFHYEWFIANYWTLTALFLAFGLTWRNPPKRVPLYLAIGSIGIALILAVHAAAERLSSNVDVDKGRGVALKFRGYEGVAFIPGTLTHSFATTAPNPVLWAQYLYTFSHVDLREQKLRFYRYLYYSGVNEQALKVSLERGGYAASGEIFGLQRTNQILIANPQPITPREIEAAIDEYRNFTLAFSRGDAATPVLSYAIVSPTNNLSNLDKWYERDAGQKVGDFIIYRLTLK
jgi:hypothetical protein